MSVRPYVTDDTVKEIVNRLYGIKPSKIEQQKSSDDRNFKVFGTKLNRTEERHDCREISLDLPNVNIYILKIVNFVESESTDCQCVINNIQNYLLENRIWCSKNIPDIHGRIYSHRFFSTGDSQGKEEKCLIKLLTYLEGKPLRLHESAFLTEVDRDVGILLSQFHNILQKFPKTNLAVEPTNPWALENPLVVLEYVTPQMEHRKVDMVKKAIQNLSTKLEDSKTWLPKGIIHGDFHDMNIIVQSKKEGGIQEFEDRIDRILKIYGIIDLNEISYSYLVLEVGRLIGDRLVSFIDSPHIDESIELSNQLLTVVCNVLDGYQSLRKLCPYELDILYWAISFTFCQYYVLGEYNKGVDPSNTFAYEAADQSSILIEIWLKIETNYFLKKIESLSGAST